MGLADGELLAILRIGHETSIRGAGISLRDALAEARYAACRPGFTVDDLRSLLAAHPSLVEEWLAYSEDKRTSGGWYVLRSGVIGQVSKPSSSQRFDTVERAVAEYVVRELDFWARLPV
jgi:hypothetical protein